MLCSCTHNKPCDPPCSWHSDKANEFPNPICSTCFTAVNAVVTWFMRSHRPKAGALIRNAKRISEGN